MCFHSQFEIDKYIASKKLVGNPVLGFIIMRDPWSKAFQEAYYVNDVRDEQMISNTIRNLRAWHPGDRFVDLLEVNRKRMAIGLLPVAESFSGLPLSNKGIMIDPSDGGRATMVGYVGGLWCAQLPSPTGEAPPSEDPDEEYDEEEYEEAASA